MSSANPVDSSNAALVRAEWQEILFANKLRRLDLIALTPDWVCHPVNIRVHRNHAFEHIVEPMAAYFAFAQKSSNWTYSDYDDAFTFRVNQDEKIGVEIVWVDLSRYSSMGNGELIQWFNERLSVLRRSTSAPVLVLPCAYDAIDIGAAIKAWEGRAGVRVMPVDDMIIKQNLMLFDDKKARLSGTRLSDSACLIVAKELACRCIPAILQDRIRAVVFDLDNTLFQGVLGEDGIDVRLTDGHLALQNYALHLRSQGLFLGLCSRNEERDVQTLFEARTDFPLSWSHFSATAISWKNKVDGLRRIAERLRIGLDRILFVDDNPGEIASVASALPQIQTLFASANAHETVNCLTYFPGIWSWAPNSNDALRVSDLDANQERDQLLSDYQEDPVAYMRSLRITLEIHVSPVEHLVRLHELSSKTNQFNLNLQRMSEGAIADAIQSPQERIVAIRLSDRLADSGIIGLLATRKEGDHLLVYETAISCRALGRELEDVMIYEALRAVKEELPASDIHFAYCTGPRNNPARQWLVRFSGQEICDKGIVNVTEAINRMARHSLPIQIERTFHEIS